MFNIDIKNKMLLFNKNMINYHFYLSKPIVEKKSYNYMLQSLCEVSYGK